MADLAAGTRFPRAESGSMGANLPGKPRQPLHQFGLQEYVSFCRESAENGYSGVALR